MKRIGWAILVVLLVFLSFSVVGIDRFVTSGDYTVHRGETLHGGMFISSPGVVTIEEGARVDGSVFMGSGVLNLNGEVTGGLFSLSGEVHTGPNAIVNGHATVTSVPFEPNPGTRINKNVTADVSGWMGGPLGTSLVLLALAFYLLYGQTVAKIVFRREPAAAASEADLATRRAMTFSGGALLVAIGALLLLRAFGTEIDPLVFALAILVLGAALFGVMFMRGRSDSPLAVPAAVLTVTGAVTMVQVLTDHWESWAYTWALVLPASIGLGRVIEGWWGQSRERETWGVKLAGIGIGLFVAGWVFFEVIVPATENSLLYLGALLLIAGGLYLLVSRGRRAGGRASKA